MKRPRYRVVYIMPRRITRAVRAALGLPPALVAMIFVRA